MLKRHLSVVSLAVIVAVGAAIGAYMFAPWPGAAGAGPEEDAQDDGAGSVEIAMAEHGAAHDSYVKCVEDSGFIVATVAEGEGLRPSHASFEVTIDQHGDPEAAKAAATEVFDQCRAAHLDGAARVPAAPADTPPEEDIYAALDRVRACVDEGGAQGVAMEGGPGYGIHLNDMDARVEITWDQTQSHYQCSLKVYAETGVPPQFPFYLDRVNPAWDVYLDGAGSMQIAVAEKEVLHGMYVRCVEDSGFIIASDATRAGDRVGRARFEVTTGQHGDAEAAAQEVYGQCRAAAHLDLANLAVRTASGIPTEAEVYAALDLVRACMDEGGPGVTVEGGLGYVIHFSDFDAKIEITLAEEEMYHQCSLKVYAETGVQPQLPYVHGRINPTWDELDELAGNTQD